MTETPATDALLPNDPADPLSNADRLDGLDEDVDAESSSPGDGAPPAGSSDVAEPPSSDSTVTTPTASEDGATQPALVPEPVSASEGESGDEAVAAPAKKSTKRKRASVPSWDEIMFGGPKRS